MMRATHILLAVLALGAATAWAQPGDVAAAVTPDAVTTGVQPVAEQASQAAAVSTRPRTSTRPPAGCPIIDGCTLYSTSTCTCFSCGRNTQSTGAPYSLVNNRCVCQSNYGNTVQYTPGGTIRFIRGASISTCVRCPAGTYRRNFALPRDALPCTPLTGRRRRLQ